MAITSLQHGNRWQWMAMGWQWDGNEVAMRWQWDGNGVAIGWQ